MITEIKMTINSHSETFWALKTRKNKFVKSFLQINIFSK